MINIVHIEADLFSENKGEKACLRHTHQRLLPHSSPLTLSNNAARKEPCGAYVDRDTRFVYVCADTDILCRNGQNHAEGFNTQSCKPV